MFERFTSDARTVVVDAQGHARRLGHRPIGTDHVLLALCRAPRVGALLASLGLTAEVVEAEAVALRTTALDRDRAALASLGIDLDRVVQAVEASHGPGALDVDPSWPSCRRSWRRRRHVRRLRSALASARVRPVDHIPFTPRTKKCLELALREALRLGHRTIGPEHLALGLLREGGGAACRILVVRGVPVDLLVVRLEGSLQRSA